MLYLKRNRLLSKTGRGLFQFKDFRLICLHTHIEIIFSFVGIVPTFEKNCICCAVIYHD